MALCERSLLAMAHNDWGLAEELAGQARGVLIRAGAKTATSRPWSARRRPAWPCTAETSAARQQLVDAQRLRPVLTYAIPYIAVQARIELARVHLALADMAGARALMREIDGVLKRQPELGTLVSDAHRSGSGWRKSTSQAFPEHRPSRPQSYACCRCSPRTCHSARWGQVFLSQSTVKSQAVSIYHKLGAATRSQAVTRARELGLLEG